MKRFWAVFWPVAKFPAFLEAKFARIQCHLVVFGFWILSFNSWFIWGLGFTSVWMWLCDFCSAADMILQCPLTSGFWGSWRSLSIAIHVLMVWGWGNAKPPPCQKAVVEGSRHESHVWVCHCMLSMVQLSDWANKYWQSLTNDGLPSFSTSDIFQNRWSYPKGLPSHSNAFAWVCIAQLMWRSPVQLVTSRGAIQPASPLLQQPGPPQCH